MKSVMRTVLLVVLCCLPLIGQSKTGDMYVEGIKVYAIPPDMVVPLAGYRTARNTSIWTTEPTVTGIVYTTSTIERLRTILPVPKEFTPQVQVYITLDPEMLKTISNKMGLVVHLRANGAEYTLDRVYDDPKGVMVAFSIDVVGEATVWVDTIIYTSTSRENRIPQ